MTRVCQARISESTTSNKTFNSSTRLRRSHQPLSPAFPFEFSFFCANYISSFFSSLLCRLTNSSTLLRNSVLRSGESSHQPTLNPQVETLRTWAAGYVAVGTSVGYWCLLEAADFSRVCNFVSGTRSGLQERGTLCDCSRPRVVRNIPKTSTKQHDMDPPVRTHKRRALLAQTTNASPSKYAAAGSPSLFTSDPKSIQGGADTRRPRSSQTVSIGWDENEDSMSRSTSRLQIELAECVETKTVTTTTTTKRSYPPILLQHKPLQSLDTKEYPLALNPTPPELTRFSYEIDGQLVNFSEGGSSISSREVRHINFSTQVKAFGLKNANFSATDFTC